jgi:AraC family transcriptional regulator
MIVIPRGYQSFRMLMLETAKYLGTNKTCVETGGLFVSLTQYREEKTPGFPQHAHVNPHLTFLLQGGTKEKWRDGVYDRFAGDIVFYPAGEPHQNLQTLGGSKNINFEFAPSFFAQNDLDESAIAKAAGKTAAAKFLLLNVYREMLFGDPGVGESIRLLLLDLLAGPERLYKKESGSSSLPEWVGKVRECLADRWNEKVSLQELSRMSGVHPITISKHFPRYFSCTLGEYLRRLKTEKALALVKSSNLSLIEIAFECGFADQSHFIRVFKGLTGFIPNDFRKL